MRRQIYLTVLAGCLSYATAQTQPRLNQIADLQQIRIGGVDAGDTRPGTLVDSRQLQLERWVSIPTWLTAPEDAGQLTICMDHVFGVTVPPGPIRIVRSSVCYTQLGLADLLTDPAWLAWWNVHKTDPPRAGSREQSAVLILANALSRW